jgi:hypothetical protein
MLSCEGGGGGAAAAGADAGGEASTSSGLNGLEAVEFGSPLPREAEADAAIALDEEEDMFAAFGLTLGAPPAEPAAPRAAGARADNTEWAASLAAQEHAADTEWPSALDVPRFTSDAVASEGGGGGGGGGGAGEEDAEGKDGRSHSWGEAQGGVAAQSGLEAGEESDAGACTHSTPLKHVEGLDVAAQNNLSLQGLGLLSPLVASGDDG